MGRRDDDTSSFDSLPVREPAAGNKKQMLEETSPQIGDLVHSYSPFTEERHPALVIGERNCPEYGRILTLLLTLRSGETVLDEWPVEHW